MNFPAIQTHETLKKTINARELHTFLEIGKDFSSWMKVQINRADLLENKDYVVLTLKGEQVSGAKTKTEYFITITSASDIGMMSQTAKGKEVRNYYRDCEQKAQAAQPKIMTLEEMTLKVVEGQRDKISALEYQIDTDKPKVTYANAVLSAQNPVCVRLWVKTLQGEHGLAWGERKVWTWMRESGYVYKDKEGKNMFYAAYKKWFSLENVIVATSHGNKQTTALKINGQGQIDLGAKLLEVAA